MALKSRLFLFIFLMGIISFLTFTIVFAVKSIKPANPVKTVKTEEEDAATIEDIKEFLTVKDGDIVIGSKNAPVKIFWFDSYSCLYCAKFFTKVLPEIKIRYIDTGKVVFIHRDFPIDWSALDASKLIKCYYKKYPSQEDVFKIMGKVFRAQDDWVASRTYMKTFEKIFTSAGLKDDEIKKCIENDTLKESILEDRLKASKLLKIDATPMFFINGAIIEGNGFRTFEAEIEKALNESK